MARTRATLWSHVWRDEDWRALSKAAQRLYLVLLSQPKLSTAGCLDLMPHRWVGLAADETPEALAADLDELARQRFVVVDGDELVIRTFVANDLCAGTVNKNLLNGMWSAWEAIGSRMLRKVVVDNAPVAAWEREGVKPPAEALEMRSEPRLELRFDTPAENHGSDHGSDSGSNHLLPESATGYRPPAGVPGSPNPVILAKHAALELARQQIQDRVVRGEIGDPQAVAARKATEDLWPILGAALTALAEQNPDATPEQIVKLAQVDPLTNLPHPAGYPTVDQAAQERPRLAEVKPDKTPPPPKAVGLAGSAAARAALGRRSEAVPS